jgi:hypothetical protein
VAKVDEVKDAHLPPEVRELVEQHRREVAALRDQGVRAGNEHRREAELKAAALRQEAEQKAQAVRDEGNRAASAALEQAKQEVELRRAELLEQLAELQGRHVAAGQTPEAEAVARQIADVQAEPAGDVLPAPNNLEAYRARIGEAFLFSVTGTTTGPLWGTDVYTTDSSPAKAAVHAGILRAGETGVVKVTIVDRLPSYRGTTRNGVTSSPWHDPWHGAYRIEAAI